MGTPNLRALEPVWETRVCYFPIEKWRGAAAEDSRTAFPPTSKGGDEPAGGIQSPTAFTTACERLYVATRSRVAFRWAEFALGLR